MLKDIDELHARLMRLEAKFKRIDSEWFISYQRISSTWGWALPADVEPFLDEAFGAGTLRGGRPVIYERMKYTGADSGFLKPYNSIYTEK